MALDYRLSPVAKLTDDNGQRWLEQMRSMLHAAQCWDSIRLPATSTADRDKWLHDFDGISISLGSVSLSSEPGTSAGAAPQVARAAQQPLPDDLDDAAYRRDMRALGILTAHMTDGSYHRYEMLTTASAVYNAVRNRVILIDRFNVSDCQTQLTSIKQLPKERISKYFGRGRELASRLALQGEGLEQSVVVKVLVRGLTKDFDDAKKLWLLPNKPVAEIEYWAVLSDLEFREQFLPQDKARDEEKAAKALAAAAKKEEWKDRRGWNKSKEQGRGKGGHATCIICRGTHDVQKCPRLLPHAPAPSPAPAPAPAPAPRYQPAQFKGRDPTPRAMAYVAQLGPISDEERDALIAALLSTYSG